MALLHQMNETGLWKTCVGSLTQEISGRHHESREDPGYGESQEGLALEKWCHGGSSAHGKWRAVPGRRRKSTYHQATSPGIPPQRPGSQD